MVPQFLAGMRELGKLSDGEMTTPAEETIAMENGNGNRHL